MGKNNIRTKVTKVFNISSKLRECDPISIGDYRGRVSIFIKNNPLLLWNTIHKKDSKISLVRTAYSQLKNTVRVIAPEKVIVVDKLHELYKSRRKLIKEINQELHKVNGKPNEDLINSNRKEIAELNKAIKRINK
ncbi:MAG: hypothetical protein ACJ0QH_05245 [Flavobacteriales bacterium]